MKFAKDRNLVDFNDRKDKDDTPKWVPTATSQSFQVKTGKPNLKTPCFVLAPLQWVAVLLFWRNAP